MKEAIVPKIYNPQLLDEKITIGDDKAFETTRLLAAKEGIFVGMCSDSRYPESSRKKWASAQLLSFSRTAATDTSAPSCFARYVQNARPNDYLRVWKGYALPCA